MWKFVAVAVVVIAVFVFGFSLVDVGGTDVSASAVLMAPETDASGYASATEPLDWQFPRDHGSHDEYQTEWWYYTGNLSTEDGRRFGYQFTIFRRAISPETVDASDSEWRTNQIHLAHFTVSDIESQAFYHDERLARAGGGVAGALPNNANPDAEFHVWLNDWSITAGNDEVTEMLITAESPQGFAVDFTLTQAKAPTLQGDNGLSAKSAEEGNASHYYSLTRLSTEGTITIDEETFTVSGNSWMDHEFSTSALDENALGWDWFGLQFDDGREIMVGQIRQVDGGKDPYFGGMLTDVDGTTYYLDADTFTIEATDTWTSPHTGATYPAGWQITVNAETFNADDDLVFNVTPLQSDQELHGGGIAYWEGAVELSGDVSGYGYAELTGYVDAMTGRF